VTLKEEKRAGRKRETVENQREEKESVGIRSS